ncbi:restriction endonuclease [Streptomyces sp. NPDC048664]|uniref:restriction endonuclease n=1 Tax=Streptomyces sp. NPDC048664 TaxID=3154505 RepID=UPI00343A643B
MTIPVRPVRPIRPVDRDRRFDLRTTAWFFLLLAIILCVLAFLARTAAGVVERRPAWAAVLVVLAVTSALALRPRWRRFSAARCARRATRALEEAAQKASRSLAAPAPGQVPASPVGVPAPQAPDPGLPLGPDATQALTVPLHPGGDEATVPLDDVLDYSALDPDGFERAIADLCARDDCREVEVVGGAGDLGADVTALTADGRRVVIQCKQYGETNKVGSQDMQRFGGTCFAVHEADVAAVVTTSDFTEPALAYAEQCGILCVNGEELAAWTDGTGPGPWEREIG